MIRITLALIVSVCMLTGCVTGTRNLENLQVPQYSNDKTANGSIYINQISDSRQFEQKPKDPSTPSVRGDLNSLTPEQLATLIGRQRNGYGAAMGDVALPEGILVQDKVRELLTEGFESRGYTIVDDQNAETQVSIDVDQFWAWFTPGFASVSFESNVECSIEFMEESNHQSFTVKGYGINKGQVASNANWELAFSRAFEDFLKNLDSILDGAGL